MFLYIFYAIDLLTMFIMFLEKMSQQKATYFDILVLATDFPGTVENKICFKLYYSFILMEI